MLTAVFRLSRVSWFPFAFSFSSCSKTEIRGISARHPSCWLTQQQSQSTNPNQWKSSASPGSIFIHSSKTGGWYVYIGYWMRIRKLKSEKNLVDRVAAVGAEVEAESQNFQAQTATHPGTMAASWEDLHSLNLATTTTKHRSCITTVRQLTLLRTADRDIHNATTSHNQN